MSDALKWFCFRCLKNHEVVSGEVKCDAPPRVPMTSEQMRKAVQWALDHPIEVFEGDR